MPALLVMFFLNGRYRTTCDYSSFNKVGTARHDGPFCARGGNDELKNG